MNLIRGSQTDPAAELAKLKADLATAQQAAQGNEALKAQVVAAQQRMAEYEKLLLDPSYVEFIATRGKERIKPKEEEKVDIESLSNAELVEYILTSVKGAMNEAVVPLHRTMEARTAAQDVKEAAGRHKDFWEYKEEMLKIAEQHPTLSAEEVYRLTKATVGEKPAKSAVRSEIPSNAGTPEKPAPKGFQSAFAQAYKETFGAGGGKS